MKVIQSPSAYQSLPQLLFFSTSLMMRGVSGEMLILVLCPCIWGTFQTPVLLARPHCPRKLDQCPSIHKKNLSIYTQILTVPTMCTSLRYRSCHDPLIMWKKAYFSWNWIIKASLHPPLFPCPVEKCNFYFVWVLLLLLKGWWSLPSVSTLTRSRSLKRSRLLLRQIALDWHITLWSQSHSFEKSVYSYQGAVLSVYRSEYYLRLSPVWFVSLAKATFCVSLHIFPSSN